MRFHLFSSLWSDISKVHKNTISSSCKTSCWTMNLKHLTCHRSPLTVLCHPPTKNHQVALDEQSPMVTDMAYQIILSHSWDSSHKTRTNYNIPVHTQNTTEKRHLWAISMIAPNRHLEGENDIQGCCGPWCWVFIQEIHTPAWCAM
jgi:hypothetical protein